MSYELEQLSIAKQPITNDNYIGIEIEFLISQKDDKDLQSMLINNKLYHMVHLGNDNSVQDLDFIPQIKAVKFKDWTGDWNVKESILNLKDKKLSREIRILSKESDIAENIYKICYILKKCKATVNNSCGLHVHIDMRNRNIDKVYNNFYFMQNALYSTQPSFRKLNRYCQKLTRKVMQPHQKYYGINRLAYNEHRTIEIRLHEGTILGEEILNWVETLIYIANMKVNLAKQRSFNNLKLPDYLKGYLNDRIKKYSRE